MASQSKALTFFLLDHLFDPFTEYGNWNYVSHNTSRLPDSKMQTQSYTIEISYFIQKKLLQAIILMWVEML
jgi:hypothetical protein